jgi:hypothetical protein
VNWLIDLWDAIKESFWNWKARGHWATRGYFWIEGKLYNGEGDGDMAYILGDDKKVQCSVAWVDKKGKPAVVDGAPAWASSDDSVCAVADVAADGMSATLVGGDPGGAQINVMADADLGAGVREVVATLDVQVVAGEAVAGTLTPGEPVDQ